MEIIIAAIVFFYIYSPTLVWEVRARILRRRKAYRA